VSLGLVIRAWAALRLPEAGSAPPRAKISFGLALAYAVVSLSVLGLLLALLLPDRA
jgi:hypothetical protein